MSGCSIVRLSANPRRVPDLTTSLRYDQVPFRGRFWTVLSGVVANESLPEGPEPFFSWDFANNTDLSVNDGNLSSCGTYQVVTSEKDSLSDGQFNLRVFSPNVTPIDTDVGKNASNLQWQVSFPPNMQVMLGMVDGHGLSGEVKGPYNINETVENGSCLPTNGSSKSSFQVTTNVTTVDHCDPVGIFVEGGQPPYNATIVVEGIGILSRSMNDTDDLYTWFNVAPSGRRMIFSAQDSLGKLATSSHIVTSSGSGDQDTFLVSCAQTSFSQQQKSKPRTFLSKLPAPWPLFLLALIIVASVAVLYVTIALLMFSAIWVFQGVRRWLGYGVHPDLETGAAGDVDTRPHTPALSMGPQDDSSRPDTPVLGTGLFVAVGNQFIPTVNLASTAVVHPVADVNTDPSQSTTLPDVSLVDIQGGNQGNLDRISYADVDGK